MEYRRLYQPGGWYFFTVVTYQRNPLLTRPGNIARLRRIFRRVQGKRPFVIEAIVVLPDHLHTVWRLPGGDADYSTRWRMIKHDFSITVQSDTSDRSRTAKREKEVWQRRFWEHTLRDETDWRRHIDYIHYNPVKHGYTSEPSQWPYSSFAKAARSGWYDEHWGRHEPDTIKDLGLE